MSAASSSHLARGIDMAEIYEHSGQPGDGTPAEWGDAGSEAEALEMARAAEAQPGSSAAVAAAAGMTPAEWAETHGVDGCYPTDMTGGAQ